MATARGVLVNEYEMASLQLASAVGNKADDSVGELISPSPGRGFSHFGVAFLERVQLQGNSYIQSAIVPMHMEALAEKLVGEDVECDVEISNGAPVVQALRLVQD